VGGRIDKVTDTVFRMEEEEAFQESLCRLGRRRTEAAPKAVVAPDSVQGQNAQAIAAAARVTRSPSRFVIVREGSAVTTRARAAAARSTRTATCGSAVG